MRNIRGTNEKKKLAINASLLIRTLEAYEARQYERTTMRKRAYAKEGTLVRYMTISPEKSLYAGIVEELRIKARGELLEIFKKEVLNFDIDNDFLTKEEKSRLAEYWAWRLRDRFMQEKAKNRAKDLGIPYINIVGSRSGKEAAFLLKKGERAQEMRTLSNRWERRVESSFGTTQGITDDELINAIAQMRLLRRVEPPFDYERYMKHLFKGRQKGRANKAFLER